MTIENEAKCPECGSGVSFESRPFVRFICQSRRDRDGNFSQTEACKTIARLHAEVTRLREALENIERHMLFMHGEAASFMAAYKIATAALSPATESEVR